jgi:hypothetical protein
MEEIEGSSATSGSFSIVNRFPRGAITIVIGSEDNRD